MFSHTRASSLACTFLTCTLANAGGPVIDIPPGSLPTSAWFAANPDATVNVFGGENIFPDSGGGNFGFNGATVNIESTASSGFFTLDQFLEDVTYNINGGELVRAKFTGTIGTTTLNINSGSAERGLWMQGNSTGTMTDGFIGVTGAGQAPLIVEDTASFVMNGGSISSFVLIQDSGSFTLNGGTIGSGVQIDDTATVTIAGGTTGSNGLIRDPGGTLNVTGGTVGGSFVAEQGTINMSGGIMNENGAMLNSGFGVVDPVMTMTGGALGSDFRAYDGTMTISGGIIGDRIRIGRPTGTGEGITVNLIVKSAILGGVPLDLTTTPTVITVRSGLLLTGALNDNTLFSIDLNDAFVLGEDRVRTAAVITLALAEEPCSADIAAPFGVLNFFDVSAFIALYSASDPSADLAAPFGEFNFFDVSAFISLYAAGCP
ncbi:MAG: GC-type dockerin domain-anchored protein [Phycisphaerales bacterium]